MWTVYGDGHCFISNGENKKLPENFAGLAHDKRFVVPPAIRVVPVDECRETRPVLRLRSLKEMSLMPQHLSLRLPQPEVVNDYDNSEETCQ